MLPSVLLALMLMTMTVGRDGSNSGDTHDGGAPGIVTSCRSCGRHFSLSHLAGGDRHDGAKSTSRVKVSGVSMPRSVFRDFMVSLPPTDMSKVRAKASPTDADGGSPGSTTKDTSPQAVAGRPRLSSAPNDADPRLARKEKARGGSAYDERSGGVEAADGDEWARDRYCPWYCFGWRR